MTFIIPLKKMKVVIVLVLALLALWAPELIASTSLPDGTYTVAVNVYAHGTTNVSRSADSVRTPATLIVTGGSIQAQVAFNNVNLQDISVGGEAASLISTNGDWTTYQFPIDSENATVPVSVAVTAMHGAQQTIDLAFQGVDEVTVSSITVKTPPSKVTYTAGEELDLTGLVVTLSKSDSTTQDVALADFAANDITTDKAQGAVLAETDEAVEISVNGQTVSQAITVQAATLPDGTYIVAVNVYAHGTTNASRSADSVRTPATLIVTGGSIQTQVAFNNVNLQDISVGGQAASLISTNGDWITYQFPIDSENAMVPVSVTVTAMHGAQQTIDLAFQGSPVPVITTSDPVSVDPDHPYQSITGLSPATISLTVPRTVSNAGLDVTGLLNPPSGSTVTSSPLPELNISAVVDLEGSGNPVNVALNIAGGTTVSADTGDNWDGIIHMPVVQPNNSVTVQASAGKTAAVESVIEVGFTGGTLTFSKPVRLLLPGQAGKLAGYSRNGVFTKIDYLLMSDDQTQLAQQLQNNGKTEGYLNMGNDLVIWTLHFTKFISYTETAAAPVQSKTYTVPVTVYKTGTTEPSRSADSVKSPATLIVSGGSILAQVAFNNDNLQNIKVGGKQASIISTKGKWKTYEFSIDSRDATVTVSVYVPAMNQTMTIDLAFGSAADAVLNVIKTYTVTFDSQGGSAVAEITEIDAASTISAPAAPTRTGYIFGGWYKEAAGINAWNFSSDTVDADVTLYAKWALDSAVLPDGTYTIVLNVYKHGTKETSLGSGSVQTPATLIVSEGEILAQVAFKNTSLTDITFGQETASIMSIVTLGTKPVKIAANPSGAATVISKEGEWTTYQFPITSANAVVSVTAKVIAMDGAAQTFDLAFQGGTVALAQAAESAVVVQPAADQAAENTAVAQLAAEQAGKSGGQAGKVISPYTADQFNAVLPVLILVLAAIALFVVRRKLKNQTGEK